LRVSEEAREIAKAGRVEPGTMRDEEGDVKYLLVYYGGSMPETPAAQARVMKQWTAWFAKLGSAVVDGGNPFSGAVNKVTPDGTVAKGAVGQRATGYSLIEAPSLEAATKMAKACPVIRGGAQIAVYETFNVM
jgi:hypothetical protein